jgi:hypothetical protein
MPKKHVLDLYSHLESKSCFGCVEVEAEDAPDDAASAAGPLPEEAKDDKPLGWIEIELVGADDAPVSGKRVELTLPDGKIVEQKTDAKGVVRLARIPTGDCQVRFPELDDGLIEAL